MDLYRQLIYFKEWSTVVAWRWRRRRRRWWWRRQQHRQQRWQVVSASMFVVISILAWSYRATPPSFKQNKNKLKKRKKNRNKNIYHQLFRHQLLFFLLTFKLEPLSGRKEERKKKKDKTLTFINHHCHKEKDAFYFLRFHLIRIYVRNFTK